MSEHNRRALVMRGHLLQKFATASAYVAAFTEYERNYDFNDANSVSRAVDAACKAYVEQLAREGWIAPRQPDKKSSEAA